MRNTYAQEQNAESAETRCQTTTREKNKRPVVEDRTVKRVPQLNTTPVRAGSSYTPPEKVESSQQERKLAVIQQPPETPTTFLGRVLKGVGQSVLISQNSSPFSWNVMNMYASCL